MTRSLEDKIRERAYELWEQDGRVHGRADEHWLKASLEVIGAMAGGELASSAPASSGPASPSIHEETQTAVDAAGMVAPKVGRAAKKPAGKGPAGKGPASKKPGGRKPAPQELAPIPKTPVDESPVAKAPAGRKRTPSGE
ncbi:DUF2934 domain-containing protein [Microvirga pudoricolor]|uniref:DUF2934 domain-containing protein n=1 Tax=Microvirga pudoricolor TaxID=2778729 RepID=UPI001952067B|nr:DUF2934 domain-containing protein [Microvirga pudoricolor]MBM6593270.1 DUF2934 domain-containing protein [Microvirga pudoricolor]